MDLSDVQVHRNSAQPAQLNAHAFAQGNQIHLAPGQEQHLPHEAWHVVQQRQGRVKPTMQMKGGVAVNDDQSLEREADAMGAKAARTRLPSDQRSSPKTLASSSDIGGPPTAQRASDYAGILPAHETYGDSYAFNGGRASEFTYHHIIPENRLVEVTKELKAIKAFFEALEPGPENAELRDLGNTLNDETDVLVTGAKAMWRETRIKDVTHEINHGFDNLGVQVTESEVRQLILGTAETLALLFPAFEALLKRKVQAFHQNASSGLKRPIVDALKDEAFHGAVNRGDVTAIADGLAPRLNRIVFDRTYLEAQIQAACIEAREGTRKSDPINKSKFADLLEAKLRERKFDAFYQTECIRIHEDATTEGRLKRVLQLSALPSDEDSDLAHAVQWNPGNIHRGPSSSKRLNPEDGGFIANQDDGGKRFEQAAFNVVSPEHFQKLNQLKAEIDRLLATKTTLAAPPDETKVEQATQVISTMQEVFAYGLTGFREEQWQEIGDGKMRLRLNADRERTARGNGLIP